MSSGYIGTTINGSPTIAAVAKEAIQNARGKAVKFDTDGTMKLCDTEGENAVGLVILQGKPDLEAGESFTVQIKDIGVAVAAEKIAAGDMVGTDTEGKMKKVTSGMALGMAVTATEADGFFNLQITKSGLNAGA